MKKALIRVVLFFCAISVCQTASESCRAETEWTMAEQVSLDFAPLDIAAAADGRLLFVLVPGEVLLYSLPDKKVESRISLDEPFDRLTYSEKERFLILSSASGKNLRVIQLETVHEIATSGLFLKGPADAPVKIAVFHDYQCPYCVQLVPTLNQVLDAYPEHVSLVYKNFPLTMHKFARRAATAALAAGRQGKFWDFHSALIEDYRALNEEKIQQIAADLGLNPEQFAKDLNDPAIQRMIARDINDGMHAGVRGTPTVFVNGKLLKIRSFEGLKTKIEQELKKETTNSPADAGDTSRPVETKKE